MRFQLLLIFLLSLCLRIEGRPVQAQEGSPAQGYQPETDTLRLSGEAHLRNVRQLTFGGNNAEAYWSYDGDRLIFQSDWRQINGQGCDQQFIMSSAGAHSTDEKEYTLVSTGEGRTTCGYFLPDGRLLYASTHAGNSACPTPPEAEPGVYAWPLYDTFDIYITESDGSNPRVLIGGDGYDAEATVGPDGRYIVFTSTRNGDIDLYRYDMETQEILQLTDTLGYDGGAFFSSDGSRIVWRASRPEGDDADQYRELLGEGLVQPTEMDLFVANEDGSNPRQVIDLPGANWAPFFHPSGEKILFSSNHHRLDEGGRFFDLFMVNVDGSALTQITHGGVFNSFPMFSPDGTRLVFSSNRNNAREPSRDTNVFVADWIDEPEEVDIAFEEIQPTRP